jgi:hypothetical protein
MKQRLSILLVGVMVLFIGYRLLSELTRTLPDNHASYVVSDQAVYVIAMIQADDPTAFEKDIVYGNGIHQAALWGNAWVYLRILDALHDLTGKDIELTIRLYAVLVEAIYLPGMFLFLRAVLPHPQPLSQRARGENILWDIPALALAFLSLTPSTLSVTGSVWGSLGNWLVPFMLYTAFIPWLAWLVVKYWFTSPPSRWRVSKGEGESIETRETPSLAKERQSPPKLPTAAGEGSGVRLFAIGLLYGLLFSQLHGISGLGFTELTIGVALVQILRGRLKPHSLILFLLAFALTASPRFIGDDIAGIPAGSVSMGGARAIIDWGRTGLVYPWGDPWRLQRFSGIDFDTMTTLMTIFLGGHLLLTLGLAGLIWRADRHIRPYHQRGRKIWETLFVLVQVIAMLLLVSTGWLPLLILVYSWWRIWNDRADEWDRVLFIALALALLAGPAQQIIVYAIWRETESLPLTGLLFELARFTHFVYLPYYALLGRMVWAFTSPIPPRQMVGDDLRIPTAQGAYPDAPLLELVRYILILALLTLIGLNLGVEPYPLSETVSLGSWLVLMAIGIWLVRRFWMPPLLTMRHKLLYAIPILLTLIAAGVWLRGQQPESESNPYGINPAYREVTAWIQENTPQGSLFHTVYSDSGFRYYAHRPIIMGSEERHYGLYAGVDPLYLDGLRSTLYENTFDAQAVMDVLVKLDVDYLLNRTDPAAPQFIGQADALVYQNELYAVYDVKKLPAEQTPLALYPEVYAAYLTHTPPLPEDAVIFNPAQGFVAQRSAIIDNIAALLSENTLNADQQARALDLLWVLHHARFEGQLELNPDQRAALDKWRAGKSAADLRAAGIGYLFYDDQWAGFLSDAERTTLNDPARYTPLADWGFGGGSYRLLGIAE